MNKIKQLIRRIRKYVTNQHHKEEIVQDNNFLYTEEQLMARLKFFIGVCLALTLTGIVFVVLYSLIFVTQPLNAISPIDQKFFELIVPIATFLTGTLSGIMLAGNSKEDKEAMLTAQKNAQAAADSAKTPPPKTESSFATTGFSSMPLGGNNMNNFNAPTSAGFSSGAFNSPASWGVTPISTTASGKKIVPDEEQPLR
jgi:hypothetical protein